MAESFSDSAKSMQCVVVTPERTVVETSADFVALPMIDGEMGIARQHSPIIGRLGYGEMRIRCNGETLRYYVDGGFVQVADDVVSVLTNRAIPAEALDVSSGRELLQTALARPAAGDDELAIRERLVSQARGQIRVATRVG